MSDVKHFRRKPTTIVAIQWLGDNKKAVEKFGAVLWTRKGSDKVKLWVDANQCWIPIVFGEWIAKDFIGYYPIKNEAIKQNYEEIE